MLIPRLFTKETSKESGLSIGQSLIVPALHLCQSLRKQQMVVNCRYYLPYEHNAELFAYLLTRGMFIEQGR